jgi:hypothetical protein
VTRSASIEYDDVLERRNFWVATGDGANTGVLVLELAVEALQKLGNRAYDT